MRVLLPVTAGIFAYGVMLYHTINLTKGNDNHTYYYQTYLIQASCMKSYEHYSNLRASMSVGTNYTSQRRGHCTCALIVVCVCACSLHIQALIIPTQGLLNAIIYGWTRKAFLRATVRKPSRVVQAGVGLEESAHNRQGYSTFETNQDNGELTRTTFVASETQY